MIPSQQVKLCLSHRMKPELWPLPPPPSITTTTCSYETFRVPAEWTCVRRASLCAGMFLRFHVWRPRRSILSSESCYSSIFHCYTPERGEAGGVKGGGRGGKGATDERKGTESIKRCSNCLSTLRGTKIKEAAIIGAQHQKSRKESKRAERSDKQIWRKEKVTIKSE